MNEWLKRLVSQIRELWGKWSTVQKVVFFAIIGGAFIGIILLVSLSSAPHMVPLLQHPIQDEQQRTRIATRLDEEGVDYNITSGNMIMVPSEDDARRMRSILVREDLIPQQTDPWELFDVQRWTQTDFERNVNLQRAITEQLRQHITALEDVDAASVNLSMPEDALFQEDQDPVTASIIITPKPGSDIRENRSKIEGIERLIQFAVPGLTRENITVTDTSGVVLNDFENLDQLDRLNMTRREMELKRDIEKEYVSAIREALSGIYGKDRIEVMNINVEIDLGEKQIQTTEHFPITTVPDNPNTPFNEREYVLSVPRSTEKTEERFQGSGFNPEGPPGQEGQTPPAYKDLQDQTGKWSNTEKRVNNEINTREIQSNPSPQVERITASVAIDGTWQRQYNPQGEVVIEDDGGIAREYTPVPEDQLEKAQSLVQDAIGYSSQRGDSVTVQHVQFDRSEQFAKEDAQFRRRQQIQMIILYSLIGIAVLLVSFIVFRLISREIERRRRLREEELARQHQAMREAALQSAEEEGQEVEMSVEERARLEQQENAINMAREHPEDVAQLIRTWLQEE
jgi:flagellar M-ring protein FliF